MEEHTNTNIYLNNIEEGKYYKFNNGVVHVIGKCNVAHISKETIIFDYVGITFDGTIFFKEHYLSSLENFRLDIIEECSSDYYYDLYYKWKEFDSIIKEFKETVGICNEKDIFDKTTEYLGIEEMFQQKMLNNYLSNK